MEDNSHIKLGQRVAKTRAHPYGWKYFDVLPPDEPCVLALPGSSTDNSEKANGYAKMVCRMLKNKTVPVYSVEYDYANRKFRLDREAVLMRYGQENKKVSWAEDVKDDIYYIPQYIRELYQKTFAPRLREEDGRKASMAKTARRLNMLVFVNHCQGATVAFQLETLLEKDLKALGYSEKNVDYLMRQVHSVNVAPVTPYGVSKTTNYKFVSFDDEIATSVHTKKMLYLLERKAEHRRFLQNLAQNNTAANTTEKLRPFTMNMCAFHPSPTETVFAVNNLYPLEINQDKRYAGIEHTFDSYADVEDDMRTKPGDQLSMMLNGTANWLVENALKNRHQLKELPRMEDDKTFSLMLPRAETNRFNLMDREIAIIRQRQQNGK